MNIEKIVGRLLLTDQLTSEEAIILLTKQVEDKSCSEEYYDKPCWKESCEEYGELPCNDNCTCECCYEYRDTGKMPIEKESNNLVHDFEC